MKKILAMLLALSMVVAMTACGTADNKTTTKAPAAGTTEAGTEAPGTEEGTEAGTQGSTEQVVLRFASWALGTAEDNNLERQMIAAFEKAYPHIKIEIAEDIVDPWNDALNTAAAGGNLPDVSLIAALPTAVANQWAMDLTELAKNDPEWSKVPASLVESGTYNDKLYGIPTALHLAGFFINADYFEEMNVDPLEPGFAWDDFEDAVKKLHKPSEGKAALRVVDDFVNFLPYLWDDNQGWFTYDGNELHLNSKEFIRAVKTTKSFRGYSWAGLTEDQKAQSAGEGKGDWEAWNQGYTAIWYDGTWGCGNYPNDLPYEAKFIGLSEGKSVIIPDYCFISSTTKHPQEAWEFVKFMFWGTKGINTRMDLDEADDGVSWAALPLNTDEAIIERFFKNYPVEGVEEVFRGMNKNGTVVEANKFVPGYTNARYEGMTGITIGDAEANMWAVLNACFGGELNIDDIADQMNEKANAFIKAERDAIDKATK